MMRELLEKLLNLEKAAFLNFSQRRALVEHWLRVAFVPIDLACIALTFLGYLCVLA